MSYLGRGLEQVDNISKLDNITFNGGTTYALTKDSSAFTPISSNSLLISVSGVIQQGNFSVDGTNIVFNTAVASSESCDFIMHYGTGVAFTPADSSVTKDKANFISTSSSAGLQIKGDGTTDGTLQLNCSQNTHGVKIKSPAHSASQSYTLTLPTTSPATDKMLQTDSSGNLSFVDAPSGAFTSVGSSSGTTNVDNVYFDNVFTNTYTRYKIFMDYFLPTQANVELRYKFRNGGSAQGSGYTYTGNARRHGNQDLYSVQSGSATSYGVLTYNIQTGNGEHGVRAFFDVYRPGTVDSNATMHYIVGMGTYRSYNDDSTQAVTFEVASNNYNTTAFDGIMFYFNGGQVDSHKIRIYGVTT